MSFEVGTVVRCTHVQYNGDKSDGCFPDEFLPLWAVIIRASDHAYGRPHKAFMLTPQPKKVVAGYNPPEILLSDECDKFEAVPPDEWPDEICQAVALYHLTEGER